MSLTLPEVQPDSIAPIAASLMEVLGPLVTEQDRAAVLAALAPIPFTDVASIGLEVTLPPHGPACDLSILLAPGKVPAFVTHPILHRLADETAQRESGSTWWELDTSAGGGTGGFVRQLEGVDGFAACRAAISDDHDGLSSALSRLKSGVDQLVAPIVLVGVFPDRDPAAAAALIPLLPGALPRVIGTLADHLVAAVDTEGLRYTLLAEAFGSPAAAIGCDSKGRMGLSAEFGPADRVPAMIERRWDALLAQLPDDPASDAFPHLLALQGIHDFRDLFPLTVLTGIDHLKLTPDGRLKAYVGALPFRRGEGINGLPAGMI